MPGAPHNEYSAVFEKSPFLTGILNRNPSFADSLQDPVARLDTLVHDISNLSPDQEKQTLMSDLRLKRQELAFFTAYADLTEIIQLKDVTSYLSGFADQVIWLCFHHLILQYQKRGLITLKDPTRQSLFILTLGKWGGYELNYSSDIDFIAIYDDQNIVTPDPADQPETFVRFVRDLTQMIEERTADGYVFRTDLRLRPDATPLALSLSAAETYYASFGQNWERAAMIKARPICGDHHTSTEFMRLIRSWIWRKNLDFAAIQDIHAIKRQINTQTNSHPVSGKENPLLGYNIKLGPGGIREVEFFAQTQQLIFGGRDPRLRDSTTLGALSMLAETRRITEQTATSLSDAYIYLRNIEHRLQMIADQQTHSLPDNEERMNDFAKFAGYPDTSSFCSELQQHLNSVKSAYTALFEDAPDLSAEPGNLVFTGTEEDPGTLESLTEMGFQNPARVSACIRSWHHGRYRAMRSERARQILTDIVPTLLTAFGKSSNSDEAFIRFDKFLSALPAGIPIFSLFYQNRELLDLVAEIMGISSEMAEHLGHRPDVLEGVITQDFLGALPDKDWLEAELNRQLSTARDYEDILETIRRWARDKRFHAGIHILKNLTDIGTCGPFLTDVATLALQALLPAVEKDFERVHGKIHDGAYAIIGMGRLGAQGMSIGSDLDLVAVYKASAETESDGKKPLNTATYYARLTQRLMTAFTAPTAEGKLYDVDTRLRPHGESGALAVSLEGFIQYYKAEAWVWEHMSLTRARPLAGDPDLIENLKNVIHAHLVQSRDPAALKKDIVDMRGKMSIEFGRDNFWDIKNHPGGLTDILFMVQFLQLSHAAEFPDILQTRLDEAIQKLSDHKILTAEDGRDLLEALHYARRLQNFLRLGDGDRQFNPETAPAAFKAALSRAVLKSETGRFEDVEPLLRAHAEKAYRIYSGFLGD